MPPSLRQIDSDGGTTITVDVLPDAFAGVNQTPKKLAIENNGTRTLGTPFATGLQHVIEQVGDNDGFSQLRIAADTDTLSAPYGLTAVLGGAGGVWGSTGTRGWRVTATNVKGETIGSFEATFNVTDTTKQVVLTWTSIPGAFGYKVYRTSTPGTYTSPALRATLGATTTFTDDGAATTTGAPPTTNTTGGWVLTAALGPAGGVWGSTGTRFWTVVAYDVTGVVIAVSREASFNVTDITKKVTLTWDAVAAANSFKVFRSTGAGVYNDPALRATLVAGSTTFDDDGAALTAGSLTVGQSFGIPPMASFGTAALTVNGGTLAIGQQFFYWVNRVIPFSTPEVGNPRSALTTTKEI